MPSQCSFLGKFLTSTGRERKAEKMSERMEGGFDCPYALNPYHDCPEFCFEKASEKLQNEGKNPVQDKEMKKVQRKGVTPTSSKALKSFNSCAGNFFSMNSRSYHGRRVKGMWLITDRSGVHPDCKNASNPYHKCAEYCFNNVYNQNQLGQVMKLNSLEGDKAFSTRGRTRTSLQSHCIYASIPQHECTEVCFQNGPDNNTREDVAALGPKEEIKTIVAAESAVKLECKDASPFHICDEYCFQNLPEDHDLQAMMKAKEEKKVVAILQSEVNSSNENISDSYIEYCFKNDPKKDQPGLAVKKSTEENKTDLPGEIWVNPECQFASNPYHACAEYCFQNAPERERSRHDKKLRSLKKMVSYKETSVHHPCKFASNPYHECGADCFHIELDWNKAERASVKLKKENNLVIPGERGMDPKCQFASNPYHECVEYCFQNEPERKKRGPVMKLNNQRELKKEVNNKKDTNIHPRCKSASNPYHECDAYCFQSELKQNLGEGDTESKTGKKETSYALRSDVCTKSKFGSNSFHKCSEYCSGEHPEKEQHAECIPVIAEEKKRNSPSEKRDHLIMDKSTVNLEFVEASKPNYNNVESSVGTIIANQIDKSRIESKFVEASNPVCDYVEFSEGITIQAMTKDLMPDVETKITREPSDVQQPLQLDASDLFFEWAKYCSKDEAADVKIVMQERRAFEVKNGQDNDKLKRYGLSDLEKVNAEGSFQRSLPISILFSIGFLVALFKWTEMVLSLAMSSERRKSSGRVMHKKHADSK